jgi:hypothetical protein
MSVWVPIVVALIGIIPGVLAFVAALAVKQQVTTNHGKRLGEYVELIAEKVELVELRQETQHAALANQVEQLAEDLRRHMAVEEARQTASEAAVRAALGRRVSPRRADTRTRENAL